MLSRGLHWNRIEILGPDCLNWHYRPQSEALVKLQETILKFTLQIISNMQVPLSIEFNNNLNADGIKITVFPH